MDLDNFPSSEAGKRMIGNVSEEWYDRSYVGKWLFQIMGEEIDNASRIISELQAQSYLDTATWGLCYYEEKYSLPVREDLSYEERRSIIKMYRSTVRSSNPEVLRTTAEEATGRHCEIDEYADAFTFWITVFQGESGYSLEELIKALNNAKQSHMSYGISIDFKESLGIVYGTATKEFIKSSGTDLPELNPLSGYTWYVDEGSAILTDESGDVLIK